MALGLIFREKAKSLRSIRAWRKEEDPGALPMHTGDIPTPTPTFHPSLFGGSAADSDSSSDRSDKVNRLGFGRQGERQAGPKGTHGYLPRTGGCSLIVLRSLDLKTDARNGRTLRGSTSHSW